MQIEWVIMSTTRSLALAVLLACCGATTTGCYAEAVPPPAYDYGYSPMYYNGAIVYYDGVGRPYYYGPGGVVWIPRESPYYVGYVNHWHAYGPAYRGWYARRGYAYRGYRGYRR